MKVKQPLFTVITPTFNCAGVLQRCISSIDTQEYGEIEHIIVDAGSTDGTLDISKNNRNVDVRLISNPDKGIYDAMNKGIIASKGEYIHILNADDFYVDCTVLSEIANKLSTFPVAIGDVDYFDADDMHITRNWITGSFPEDGFASGWHPCHPGFFCHRTLYEELGGFDIRHSIAADYDLMLRFCHSTQQVVSVGRVTTCMQNDGHSSSVINRIRGNLQCWSAYRKAFHKDSGLINFFRKRYRYKKSQFSVETIGTRK